MKKLLMIWVLLGSTNLVHALAYLPTPTIKLLRAGIMSGELSDNELIQINPTLEAYFRSVYATRKADLESVQTQLKTLLENDQKQEARDRVPEEFQHFLRRCRVF